MNKRDSLFISFVLGNDVSLSYVLILPTLLHLSGFINLVKGDFVCSKINRTFPLTLNPPGMGLPEGVVFDISTLTIPQRVSTNIKLISSFLH